MFAKTFLIFRIDSNFVIKVADFGLSESIDTTKEYFRQERDEAIKLPIKWLAPESINDKIFSEKTDVVKSFIVCSYIWLAINICSGLMV